jgi:hypothetical protein
MKKILLLITLLFSLNVFSNELSNAPNKISEEEIISLQRKIARKLDSGKDAQGKKVSKEEILRYKILLGIHTTE